MGCQLEQSKPKPVITNTLESSNIPINTDRMMNQSITSANTGINDIKQTSATQAEEYHKNVKVLESDSNINLLIGLYLGTKNDLWEKSYAPSTTISQIILDFKSEKPTDYPQFNVQWFINHTSLSPNAILTSLMPKGAIEHEHILTYKILSFDLPQDSKEYIKQELEYVAKPIMSPFSLMIYGRKEKKIIMTEFTTEIINENQLYTFSYQSAYCNGGNNIYISCGEKDDEIVGHFWLIHLDTFEIEYHPNGTVPKKYHSMIYIPKKYVFMIGGNDISTLYYDINNDMLIQWSDLNNMLLEPALYYINNRYIYAFANNFKDTIGFERTDLLSKIPKWDVVKPQTNFSSNKITFSQKFFSVCEEDKNSVVFLGGSILERNTEGKHCFCYNHLKNELYESPTVLFEEIDFTEKTFLPLNDKYMFMILSIGFKNAKLGIYNHRKGKVDIVSFDANSDLSSLYESNSQRNKKKACIQFGKNDQVFKKSLRSMEKKEELVMLNTVRCNDEISMKSTGKLKSKSPNKHAKENTEELNVNDIRKSQTTNVSTKKNSPILSMIDSSNSLEKAEKKVQEQSSPVKEKNDKQQKKSKVNKYEMAQLSNKKRLRCSNFDDNKEDKKENDDHKQSNNKKNRASTSKSPQKPSAYQPLQAFEPEFIFKNSILAFSQNQADEEVQPLNFEEDHVNIMIPESNDQNDEEVKEDNQEIELKIEQECPSPRFKCDSPIHLKTTQIVKQSIQDIINKKYNKKEDASLSKIVFHKDTDKTIRSAITLGKIHDFLSYQKADLYSLPRVIPPYKRDYIDKEEVFILYDPSPFSKEKYINSSSIQNKGILGNPPFR